MPQTIEFLNSEEAKPQRLCRQRTLAAMGEHKTLTAFVVWIELKGEHAARFEELDAEDQAHAERLALNWLLHCNAAFATTGIVRPDGSIKALRTFTTAELHTQLVISKTL